MAFGFGSRGANASAPEKTQADRGIVPDGGADPVGERTSGFGPVLFTVVLFAVAFAAVLFASSCLVASIGIGHIACALAVALVAASSVHIAQQ